jgi:hypothetical protein
MAAKGCAKRFLQARSSEWMTSLAAQIIEALAAKNHGSFRRPQRHALVPPVLTSALMGVAARAPLPPRGSTSHARTSSFRRYERREASLLGHDVSWGRHRRWFNRHRNPTVACGPVSGAVRLQRPRELSHLLLNPSPTNPCEFASHGQSDRDQRHQDHDPTNREPRARHLQHDHPPRTIRSMPRLLQSNTTDFEGSRLVGWASPTGGRSPPYKKSAGPLSPILQRKRE